MVPSMGPPSDRVSRSRSGSPPPAAAAALDALKAEAARRQGDGTYLDSDFQRMEKLKLIERYEAG